MQNNPILPRLFPALVFAGAFAIYLVCGTSEVGWGDSAKYATFAAEPHFEIRAGMHVGYSYVTAGLVRLVPFGSYAARANRINAFYAALALTILFMVLRRAVQSDKAAVVGIAAVALSHPFFSLATIAESYPFFMLVVSAFIAVAAKWRKTRDARWLIVGGFIAGFSICVNLSATILFPAAVVFLILTIAKDKPSEWKPLWVPLASTVLLFIVGLFPLILGVAYMWVENFYWGSSHSIFTADLFRQISDIEYAGPFFLAAPLAAAKGVAIFLGIAAYAFPLLAGILAVIGVVDQFRRDRAAAIALIVAVGAVVIFFSTYSLVQRLPFIYSTPLFLCAFWIARGARWIFEKRPGRIAFEIVLAAIILTPVSLYSAVCYAAPKINAKLASKIREIPHRDNVKYFLVPWRFAGTGTKSLAGEIGRIAEHGILFSDFTPFVSLNYLQKYEGFCKDVKLEFAEQKLDGWFAYRFAIIYYGGVFFMSRSLAPDEMDYKEVVGFPDPERGPYWKLIPKY